ncbi:hypothetical protein KSZ_28020 [Dictyobacter formicarum]|uniref:Uncharacterized protein n=1 Tax=Dictyobacter formicarum TaxID=2778368 RepID=A0ABQ3VI44_9CHLR|nr:hypothetical protein KSZ_28020 [Dictyobacter formicarum]
MIGAPSSVVFLVDSGVTQFVTIPGLLLIACWLEVDIYTINYIRNIDTGVWKNGNKDDLFVNSWHI